ncbi:MAG: outer membrane beta-barrel protein [Bacteroidota bacterium]
MKKLLLTAVAVFAFGFANAQEASKEGFAKGNMFLSGTASFGTEKNDGYKITEYTVAPKFGYFVSNNIALGLGLEFGNGKIDVDGDTVAENKTTSFGAFGRYYIKTAKFAPFAELNVNYATTSNEWIDLFGTPTGFGTGDDINTLSVNVAPGFNYFISDNFALETSVGILGYSSSKADVDGAEASNKFNIGLNLSNINLGLIYKF